MKKFSLKKRQNSEEKNPLWRDILAFNKSKYLIVLVLFILAASGLLIPIIPGLLLFILALALLRKGWMSHLRKRIRLWRIDRQE